MVRSNAASLDAGKVRARAANGTRRKAFLASMFALAVVAVPHAVAQPADSFTINIDNTHFTPVPAAGLADYEIRIDNAGNFGTRATTVTFTIPDNTDYEGVVGLDNCNPPSGPGPVVVTCDVPALPVNGQVFAQVNMRHNVEGLSVLDAEMVGASPLSKSTTVLKGADLELKLTAQPDTVQAGDYAHFVAVITNNGPYPSGPSTIEITIPVGMSRDIDMPQGCSVVGALISCAVDALDVSESIELTFKSQVTAGDLSSVAMAGLVRTTDPRDPNPANNQDTADLTIEPGTDLSLGKSRAPLGLLLVGDPVEFTLTPRVAGQAPASAQIIDTLPDNYEVAEVTPGAGWSCTVAGQLVTCNYAEIAGSDYQSPIVIKAEVVAVGQGVQNTARIHSDEENAGAQTNNTASDTAADIAVPTIDLVAHKKGPDRGLVAVGQSYDFELSSQNKGNAPFGQVLTITDDLPAGLTVTAISVPPGSGWVCPAVPPGGLKGKQDIICITTQYQTTALAPLQWTDVITLTAEVTRTTEDESLSNGMTVSFDRYNDPTYENRDVDVSNNTTTDGGLTSADVNKWADLSVVKTLVSASPVMSGAPITFRIEVINPSEVTAEDVRVTDRLSPIVNSLGGYPTDAPVIVPSGMVCSFENSGAYYYRDLSCNIASLPECQPGLDCPYVDVTVHAGGVGPQSNTAVAYSYKTPDPNTSNNEFTVPYVVTPRTDVTISKTSASMNAGAAVGQPITYVLTAGVVDSGLSPAADVVIRDVLPDNVRFISATASGGGSCSVKPDANAITTGLNNIIRCEFGTVNVGSQRTLEVVVVPTMPLLDAPRDPIVNAATVSTSTPETNTDNNSAEVSIPINPPSLDLIVSKIEYLVPNLFVTTPDPVLIGTDVGYRITVKNAGPSDATDVVLTDILPPTGFINPSLPTTSGGWSCELDGDTSIDPGGKMICRNAYFPAGKTDIFEFTMRADERGSHTNKVEVSSRETDADPTYDLNIGNNTDTEKTRVRVRSDLAITKTPEKDDVDLREEFYWDLTVHAREVPGLDVAEAVTLDDTFPAGMIISRAPEITPLKPGSVCNAPLNSSALSCDLGDIDAGDTVNVRVWVRIVTPYAPGSRIVNTARVNTQSFDLDPDNNVDEGEVNTVRASVIEGTVWRDFDASNTRQAHDSGLGGVKVDLVGHSQYDGFEITATTTTAADGTYIFDDLPPGTYQVSYVSPGVRYAPGSALPGATGTASGTNIIATIVVVGSATSSNHDFTVIPQAELSVSKTAGIPAFHSDGSYSITYSVVVTNHSDEPLENIELVDNLEGAGRNFGDYTSDVVPGLDRYTATNVPLGSGFTGETGADRLWTSGTLGIGASQTLLYTLRINPGVPRVQPFSHLNVASADGEGEWSGQTSQGPQANDKLADTDNETVTPNFVGDIEIIKTASFDGSGEIGVGDRIDYTFRIENTGNTPLVNVTIADPLEDLKDLDTSTIATLAPGEFVIRTAYYILTQDDLDNGAVSNTASTSGQWGTGPGGPILAQDSDSATIGGIAQPGLTIDKTILSTTVDPAQPTSLTDTITYQFVVTNTGNTNLSGVVVVDPLLGTDVTVGDLPVTDRSRTVTATYKVVQRDIDKGVVDNTAFARGTYGPSNTSVKSADDDESQPLYQAPGLVLVKVVDSATVPDEPRAGDRITWTVTATNTGNITLDNVSVSDPRAETVTPPASTTVAPGASIVFTVIATLTQDNVNTGEIGNQATATFTTPDGKPGTPVDSSNDPGNPDTPEETVTPLNQRPKIGLLKQMITAIPGNVGVGTELRYQFTIRNLGNLPLTSLDLDEDLKDFVLDPASIASLASATLHPLDTFGAPTAPDNEIVVEGTYKLSQVDIEAGSVTNTAEIVSYPTHGPVGEPVKDRSGTDFDDDDPTVTSLTRQPEVSLTKTISSTSFGGGLPAAGDTITYAFAIENVGNVILDDLVIEELLTGATINNPGNWFGPLAPTEVEADAITATYILTQADIEAGFVENKAEVSGIGTGPDDLRHTVTDDSTVMLTLPTQAGIKIEKSYEAVLSKPSAPGDLITYTFLVTNTGNLTLTNVVVTDLLADLDMPVTTIATLLPGADKAVELTATYRVKQADIEKGEVVNQADVAGDYVDPVTGAGNATSTSNQIVVDLDQVPDIAVVKTASSALGDPGVIGELITYSFTVTNTGNMLLTGVVIDDPLPGLNPGHFIVGDLAPGEVSSVFTATYAIDADDIAAGEVVNQAEATGTYDDGSGPRPVTDPSGPTIDVDEPTIVPVLPAVPSMTMVKTGSFANGGGYVRVGDVIDYEFLVTNTGNVALVDVTPRELDLTFGGLPASGTVEAMVPGPQLIAPGDQATFTTLYVLTQDDINNGAGLPDGVSNTADATALYDGTPVTADPDDAVLSIPTQEPANVSIVKRALISTIRRGETAPFVITATNNSLADVGLVTITDRVPNGFVFVEGSATVNGFAVTPDVAGQMVSFANVKLGPNSSVDIGLVLRALPTTPAGVYRNIANGVDRMGTPLAPPGHADVRIDAEAVFDCSDVIGTVYNDRNRNGYQDEGEPGIAGVRLSTVRGTLITTDAFGRYSVPCADLPNGNIGSNFVLKVDQRTLPTGFSMTSDNPGMVRLTAGKMVELNFGASIGREIRLTIEANAFAGGTTTPDAALAGGLDQLITLLEEHEATLFITHKPGADRALARDRVDHVVSLIRELWHRAGAPYRLVINTDIVDN